MRPHTHWWQTFVSLHNGGHNGWFFLSFGLLQFGFRPTKHSRNPFLSLDKGIAHGHVTPAMKLSILMLDSVMKWAGVVDELDFAEKLVGWYQDNGQHISSPFIHSLMKDKSNFLIAPGTVAKQINENNSDHFAFGTFDNICLPSMIGISVTQFHDISEVESNAR